MYWHKLAQDGVEGGFCLLVFQLMAFDTLNRS